MESFLIQWAQDNREFAIVVIPLLAFMETCIGIGLFVSSIFLVIVCSIFYSKGWASMESMAIMAMLGSSLGDHVGFYVGRAVGPGMHKLKIVQKNQSKWDKAEGLVRRFGSYAIFIGRFIPAIRSLIPAMLGISEFQRLRYTTLDLMACGVWALGLVAIVLGAHEVFAGT
ncbi:MAG: DedA family protein [Oceanococcus sp.]